MIALILMVIAVMTLFPRTAVGRALRVWLVERPAERLNALTAAKLTMVLLLLVSAAGLLLIAKLVSGGVVFDASLLSEGVSWLIAFDGAAYLELAIALWLIAASLRLKPIVYRLRSMIRGPIVAATSARPIGRSHDRARRIRRPDAPPAGLDDDRLQGLAWA